jgi:AcrR family transcriptional regulator
MASTLAPDRIRPAVRGRSKPEAPQDVDRSAGSRAAILAAARELFVERGYSATGITDIVERAGTSVGLPYYHFGSKKKIFITLWAEYQEGQELRTRAALKAARDAGERNGGHLLLVGMRAYLEGAWEARDMIPMMHGRDTPPAFDSVMRETNQRWMKQNRTLLAGSDPMMLRAANAILTNSLGAVCVELATCKNDAEARSMMDCAVQLFSAVLDRTESASAPVLARSRASAR